jgi:hypothetical protein
VTDYARKPLDIGRKSRFTVPHRTEIHPSTPMLIRESSA